MKGHMRWIKHTTHMMCGQSRTTHMHMEPTDKGRGTHRQESPSELGLGDGTQVRHPLRFFWHLPFSLSWHLPARLLQGVHIHRAQALSEASLAHGTTEHKHSVKQVLLMALQGLAGVIVPSASSVVCVQALKPEHVHAIVCCCTPS
jgi:hypothetical protein